MSDLHASSRPNEKWQASLVNLACRTCGWSFVVPPDLKISTCPHCFSHSISLETGVPDGIQETYSPELIIPPSVTAATVNETILSFTKGVPFSPADLNPQNLSQRKRLVYIPMWLVDCDVQSTWDAEVGFIYNVVSHQDSYSDHGGGWKSKEVSEQRTRWEKRAGTLNRNYSNITAPAVEEAATLKKSIGDPLPTGHQAFHPDLLKGAVIRLPNRSSKDSWSDAALTVTHIAANEVKKACTADHIRNFSWEPQYSGHNWTLLFYPVFSTFYVDDEGRPELVLIHGQSGHTAGRRKASMKKAQNAAVVLGTIAAVIFLLAVLSGIAGVMLPVLAPLTIIFIILAAILVLAGFACVGTAWQFNRSQP